MPHILDTNRDTRGHYDRLRAAGYDTVIRYVSRSGGSKVVSPAEAHAAAAAGFKLGLVYETNGKPRGTATGHADGVFAKDYAAKVGAPIGTIIWYTADEDTTDAIFPATRDAFIAFRDAIKPYRCGGYGSGWLLDQLYSAGIIVARWLTDSTGFRGSRASKAAGRYELAQSLPTPIAGLDTDPDAEHIGVDGKHPDIGAFVPFASPGETPPALPSADHPPVAGGVAQPPPPAAPHQPVPRPAPPPAAPTPPPSRDPQDQGRG